MVKDEPNTATETAQHIVDFQADSALVDALLQKLYGCTLDEYGQRLFEAGHRWKPAKETPPGVAFMVHKVDEQRATGVSVTTAVADFLKIMALGEFVPELPDSAQEAKEVDKFLKRWKPGRSVQKTAERRYYEAKSLKNQ
jgi:hypothetical protein